MEETNPSILVPLPPIQNKSSKTECNTSYISRLAQVYRVPVWYFIKKIIQPSSQSF